VNATSVRPYVWMLSGCLSFAVMSTLAHALAGRCDWQVIALARSGLAFAFATAFAVGAGARLVLWRPGTLWMRSLAGSVSMVCTFFALTRLPVSDVLTLTNTFPLWVALLSWPLLGEVPTGQVWVSILSGAVGVALIQQPHFAEGNWTTLLALVSSFFTAVAMIGLHRLHGLDVWAVVVHFSGVSTLFCGASLVLFDRAPAGTEAWSTTTLLMLLGVGGTATIGQMFLTRAFAAGPPARVSVVGLSQVVFAMILEALFTHESLSAAKLLGTVLVMAPTAWLLLQRQPVAEPEPEEIEPAPVPVMEAES
jgi:drug/metabolite transporter (DMT)-like permease